MSMLRLSLAIATILAIGAPWGSALGQIVSGLDSGKHPTLFIEPDAFKPDFQFFAPADATDYEIGADRDPNKGFFFTYDRLYINVTRPETRVPFGTLPSGAPDVGGDPFALQRFSFAHEQPSPLEGDFTWGNRIELGFMTCEDTGWTIVGWHIDGPNQQDQIINGDRLGGPSTDEDGTPLDDLINPDNAGDFNFQNIGGPGIPLQQWPFPPTDTTDLPIYQSVNLARMGSVEIMRLMERHYFHNGGVFEPMIGVRYIKFEDFFKYSYYERTEYDLITAGDDYEFFRDENARWENNMLGGQLGFRMFKETGHWKLSSELRMFALQNWQNYYSQVDNYIWSTNTTVDQSGNVRSPQYARQERLVLHDTENEFVWGGELKLEAAYQLTRYISFRTGFTFIDLGQGVARGRDLTFNDQDVQMYGYTFGVDINR